MNATSIRRRRIAAVFAAIVGMPILAAGALAAAADSSTETPTPAAWCEAVGTGAFVTAPTLPVDLRAGQTVTLQLRRRPECSGMPVSWAPHSTPAMRWIGDVQPLLDGAITSTGNSITFTVPVVCATNVQGDLVNGLPLPTVDPAAGALYGLPGAWRLLDVRYVPGEIACTTVPPSTPDTTSTTLRTATTEPQATTTTAPATTVPPTSTAPSQPPSTTWATTPLPPVFPPAAETPDQPTTTTTAQQTTPATPTTEASYVSAPTTTTTAAPTTSTAPQPAPSTPAGRLPFTGLRWLPQLLFTAFAAIGAGSGIVWRTRAGERG